MSRGTPKTDRRALRVPQHAHDPIAGGTSQRDLSRAHRHPWGSAQNAHNQVRLALAKLSQIPPQQRDKRIVEAEAQLRAAMGPVQRATVLLAAYYGVGRGVRA